MEGVPKSGVTITVNKSHDGNNGLRFSIGEDVVRALKWIPRDRVQIKVDPDHKVMLISRVNGQSGYRLVANTKKKENTSQSCNFRVAASGFGTLATLVFGLIGEKMEPRWEMYDGGLLLCLS